MSEDAEILGDDKRFNELMRRLEKTGVGKCVSASEWQDVENFIRENLITEERITKEYDSGKSVGIEQARNIVQAWLIGLSAEKFMANKDDEAKHFREMSKTVANMKDLNRK